MSVQADSSVDIEVLAEFEAALEKRTRELAEAHAREAASSEILRIVASSPGDSQPVFDAIVRSGAKLFPGAALTIGFPDGDKVVAIAIAEPDRARAESWRSRFPVPLTRSYLHGVCILDAKILDIPDVTDAPAELAVGAKNFFASGYRAITMVPLLKGTVAIGALSLVRPAAGPVTKEQLALLEAFAAQAVIAIENTRLVGELRESLDQQTATSKVLSVISSSPGELAPVFDAMLENAIRICDAKFGNLFLLEGGAYRTVAVQGEPLYAEYWRANPAIPLREAEGIPLDRVHKSGGMLHILDMREDASYLARHKRIVALVDNAGARTFLTVPLLKEGQFIGAMAIYRQEIRPFTDKQIALVQNFAAQAVIAIENTRLLKELRLRTEDLQESLQQQTATSDILEVISNSPTDTQPAFDAIVRSGLKLFPDAAIMIALPKGEIVEGAAIAAPDDEGVRALRARLPLPLSREFITSAGIIDRREIEVADAAHDPPSEYVAGARNFAASGHRAISVMPMMRGDLAIGALSVMRRRPGALSEKQRELLRTFAAQAVIAIENTRLFNELRQRTEDLTESLEYQTATSEILTVISRSPTDAQPVFDIIGERAEKLCDADVSVVSMVEGDILTLASIHGISKEGVDALSGLYPLRIDRETITSRTVRHAAVVHVTDVLLDPDYDPKVAARAAGYRACLGVPMMRGKQVIGVIFVGRKQARPYTDNQIKLLKTFADQAVIAIGNVRLFKEVQARTDDLQESLQQQTATADVLKVISRSTFDLQPVLDTLTESAARLCAADKGVIFLRDGEVFRVRANHGFSQEALVYAATNPMQPNRGSATGRVALEGKPVHIPDVLADPEYSVSGYQRTFGYRTILSVPLLREGVTIGVFSLTRDEVDPFSQKQIELVQTFADQAVIAIENVRLFDEVQARTEDLQESLAQQTATADVLKVISRSAFDLPTVLQALVESAARLCDSEKANITRERNGAFYRAEAVGFSQEFQDYVRDVPIRDERGSGFGRALLEGRVVHIPDVLADPEYTQKEMQRLGDYRTVLAIPMLREGATIGVLTLTRSQVRPFSEKQIELATTFADQAAIAIENVRLFEEIQDKSRQLEEASKHKSQFLANMSHELRTPLNAILGYTELIADGVYGETPEKVQTTIKRITANGKHLLGLINDVLDLSKIEAGQLTLSLADYSMKDVVYNVFGAVEPLASEKKLTFKADIAPDLPTGFGDERRLTQVLLNLVGNAIKFTDAGSVVIKAALKDGAFSVAVVDTGPGISEDDQKKLFQEFQQADSSTTKKKGGTGLGLAISKRIVEMHGGKVWLESRLDVGSTFTFTVPVRAEQQKRAAT